MNTWALQDAKAKFSALVERACRAGPQRVTRRGEDVAVVVAAAQFDELTHRRANQGLAQFFRGSPLADLPPQAFARDADTGRECVL